MGKKRITALFCAAVLAASSLPAAAEETAKVEITADQALQSVTLVSDKDTTGVLIRADRASDGALNGVTLTEVTLAAGQEAVITHEDGLGAFDAGDKLMFVDSMESMRPLTDAVTIEAGPIGTEPVDTPTAAPTEPAATPTDPVEEPTAAPTEAADEPTAEPTETPTARPTQSPKPTPMPTLDPSEWTSVEFSAGQVANDKDDEVLSTGLAVYTDDAEEPVRYMLDESAVMRVNGVEDEANDFDIYDYILENNENESVKLTDTDGNGSYNIIETHVYRDAVVHMMQENSDGSVDIYFRVYDYDISRGMLAVEQSTVVTITDESGTAFDISELKENDVLSIAWDVFSGFTDSSFYDIKLTRKTVTGEYRSTDHEKYTVTIGDTEYRCNDRVVNINDFEADRKYTLYLNMYGEAVYMTEGESIYQYGVLAGMYTKAGDELPTVRLITSSGSIIEEKVRDEDEANKFFTLLKTESDIYPEDGFDILEYDGGEYTLENSTALLVDDMSYNVFMYDMTDQGLVYVETMDNYNISLWELSFNAADKRLGRYPISEQYTKIINVEKFFSGDADEAEQVSINQLSDGYDYKAYVYGGSDDDIGSYRFIVIADGIGGTGEATAIDFNASAAVTDHAVFTYDKVATNGYLPVKTDNDSGATRLYHIAENAKFLVNDIEVPFNDMNIVDYVYDNRYGVVTITDNESDGIYDTIEVDFYYNAVVDHTESDKDGNTVIYFKSYPYDYSYIVCGRDVTVTIEDAGHTAIKPEELLEYDVLSIQYDVNHAFSQSKVYDIALSRETVTGKLGSIDEKKSTVSVNGAEYDCIINTDNMELAGEYEFYLNAYGDIVYAEKNRNAFDYGVVIGMYTLPGDELPTVRLMTSDGSVTERIVRSAVDANYFFTLVKTQGSISPEYGDALTYDGGNYTISDVRDDIKNNVCRYSDTSNGLRYVCTEQLAAEGTEIYHSDTGCFGTRHVSDKRSLVVNAGALIDGISKTASAVELSELSDGGEYDIYAYDYKKGFVYGFVIITEGIESELPEGQESVGIAAGIYMEPGNDLPTVRILNADGTVTETEAADAGSADSFYALLFSTGASPDVTMKYSGETVTFATSPELIGGDIQNNVCRYTLLENGVRFVSGVSTVGGAGLVYNAAESMMGDFAIDKEIKIADLEKYISGEMKTASPLNISELSDGAEYAAYFCEDIMIVTDGAGINKEQVLSEGIGVAAGMYTAPGGYCPRVRIITEDGDILDAEARSTADADGFFALIADGTSEGYDGEQYTKSDVLGLENNVCRYKVTVNGVSLEEVLAPEGGSLVYDADANAFGAYTLDGASIIDIGSYTDGTKISADVIEPESLIDGSTYKAYVYGTEGKAEFVLVLNDRFRTEANIAVVNSDSRISYNEVGECMAVDVLIDSDMTTILYDKSIGELHEGDVIAYSIDNNGFVSSEELVVLMDAYEDYDELIEMPNELIRFSEMLKTGDNLFDPETNHVKYGTTDRDVKQYLGAVYYTDDNKLGLFCDSNYGIVYYDTAHEFELNADTNVYIYDYEYRQGRRLSVGSVSSLPRHDKSDYNYASGGDGYFYWGRLQYNYINPSFAYVKTVDEEVTDVVMLESDPYYGF